MIRPAVSGEEEAAAGTASAGDDAQLEARRQRRKLSAIVSLEAKHGTEQRQLRIVHLQGIGLRKGLLDDFAGVEVLAQVDVEDAPVRPRGADKATNGRARDLAALGERAETNG